MGLDLIHGEDRVIDGKVKLQVIDPHPVDGLVVFVFFLAP